MSTIYRVWVGTCFKDFGSPGEQEHYAEQIDKGGLDARCETLIDDPPPTQRAPGGYPYQGTWMTDS